MRDSRGRWLRREEWHSICSRHQVPRDGCPLCGRGCWRNVWLGRLSRLAYAVAPRLWRRWANRNRGDY